MPDNPDAVAGSVSRDDEQGTQPGTRDETALLLALVGCAALLIGVAFEFGWEFLLIVGGAVFLTLGILLGFGGDD